MSQYFSKNFEGVPFQALSPSHIYMLTILFTSLLLIILYRKSIKKSRYDVILRSIIILFLLTPLITFQVYHIVHRTWDIGSVLPLEFCRMAAILSAIMLINKNDTLFEITFFWGFCGTTQALITPNIGNFGFPHFLYFQFFFYHIAVLVAVVYVIAIDNFRPTHKSLWKVAIFSSFYTIAIGFVDFFTGGNYLYLRNKPESQTLIDYLGPWPIYILSIGIAGVISAYFFLIPFVIYKRLKKN